ncbi:DUF2267 domain-containing protein [Haladaptatus salinisoli]|uniref:DUF2267 domain-containing protein n=1 Tax=Haladaptatus salinisoli TaxID=2884876 RepID=UPI001D0A4BD3|nr:DUF2267 domain-containing protein [Haladaptatus salinisoli]
MDRDTFIDTVQQRADFSSREEATDATQAVLTTLGERITENEAEDLAAQLPAGLDDQLTEADSHANQFSFEEFAEKVADRADADAVADDPRTASQAVSDAVQEAVGTGEFQDVISQLPENEEYGGLLSPAE